MKIRQLMVNLLFLMGLLLIVWLIRVNASTFLFATASSNDTSTSESSNHTLVLLVANGDNNLDQDMLEVVNEAERAAGNPHVTIFLWLDGPSDGDSYVYHVQEDFDGSCPTYSNPTCFGRYVEGDNFWTQEEDVATAEGLAAFFSQALQRSPTPAQIVLSIVGHGGGWAATLLANQPTGYSGEASQPSGLLWDNHPGTSLSTAELGRALNLFRQATAEKVDLLYLDASLMASSEVAYEIRQNVNYLLASESWTWGSFPYEAHLNAIEENSTAREIGEAWLANEVKTLEPDDYPFAFSLTDLSQMNSVRQAQDDLAEALIDLLPAEKGKIEAAFAKSDCFDSNGDGVIARPGRDFTQPLDIFCDLDSFAGQIRTQFSGQITVVEAARQLQNALSLASLAQAHNNGLAGSQPWAWHELGGLTTYLPLVQDEWRRRYYSVIENGAIPYLQSARDGKWDEFLAAYWNNAEPPADPTCPAEGCALPQGVLPAPAPQPAANMISLMPAYGLNEAPTSLYIKGHDFSDSVTVLLGTERLSVTNVMRNEEPNQLRVIVPAGLEPGAYDVTVQSASGVASASNGYDVLGETDDLLSSSDWMWSEPFPMRVGFTESSVGLLVQHLGGSTTVDSVTVEFRLDRPDGDLLGRSLTNLLAPNATESSGPVTWQPDAPGEYTICALIDPDNQVEETDEENNITCHSFTVLPYPVGDTEPPEVDQFSIKDDAQTTEEEAVTVDIAATDYPDPGASGMEATKIVEFEYSYGARRWVPVKQSGWENYFNTQNDYPWTLRETYGMRYVQAWATDKKRNISLKPGTDVIDLLPSLQADYVAKDGITFYRILLEEGESFTATMTPVEGEPDMFIWGPNAQVWFSDNATGVEQKSFNAPVEGTYQIEIHGTTNARYRLTFGETALAQTRSIQHAAGGREIPTEPAVPLDDWPEYYDIQPPAPIEENIEENMIYLPLTIR